MKSTNRFLINFFPLRGNQGFRRRKKNRKPGYYWVIWSMATHNRRNLWVIATLDHFGNWQLPGSDRKYREEDFLRIGCEVEALPWAKLLKWVILFTMIWLIFITVVSTIVEFKKLSNGH